MGTTEIQLGRWLAAEQHLQGALASTEDPWIVAHRTPLMEALGRVQQNLADLEVVCPVAGAALSVNGQPVGTFPLMRPVRVVRGNVTIDVTAPGHDSARQVAAVTSANARAELSMVRTTTERAPEPVLVAVQATAATPAVAPTVAVAEFVSATPEATVIAPAPSGSGGPLRGLGIAAVVLGGIGAGVGALGWVLRDGNAHDFNAANCWTQQGAVMGGGNCSTLYDDGQTMNTVAIAGAVAGGAFLVGGIAMLIAAPSGGARTERAWSCGSGPGTVGVSCRVGF
ncbi:MAG: hypothetical protein IPF99_30960 [Deltaproteobacteria bacterium]|nr:hypothetical protein [Deltaproteobacteria bacterium]